MGDETRDWEQIRRDAHRAVIEAADDFGHDDLVMGGAEKLADAVLAVCDEEAVNRMADVFVNETRIRGMDFRNGASMGLVPSETLVSHWIAAAKTWFDAHPAPNYTETEVEFGKAEMEVKLAGEFERYVFILQRVGPGKLTPHEARKQAEVERDAALSELAQLQADLAAGRKDTTEDGDA